MTARRYLSGITEAALLAAVAALPPFYNCYTVRVFDPDKVALMRSLVTIGGAAWILLLAAKLLSPDEGQVGLAPWLRHALRRPLPLAILAILLSNMISTAFSVVPAVSLWGSYLRLQGLYTTACYLGLFMFASAFMCSTARREWLAIALSAASVPVAISAIAQKLDPQPALWSADTSRRVISAIGNPIFLGAYLAMVSPLALRHVLQILFPEVRSDIRNPWRLAALAFWTLVASLQVMALLLTQSRGPLLGWVVSASLLGTLWFVRLGMRRTALASLLMPGVIAVLFLAAPSSAMPGRYKHMLDTEHRNTKARLCIWQSVFELVKRNPQIGCSDENTDRFTALRPLLGYGPDSLMTVFGRAYRSELNRYEDIRDKIPDRAHNQTWNVLAETGIAGAACYLGLVAAILMTGASALGLARNRHRRIVLGILIAGGAAAAAALFAAWGGGIFLGPAVPLGMVGGLFALVAYSLLAGQGMPGQDRTPEAEYSLTASVFAALAGHIVESQFGIPTTPNLCLFWIMLGILAVTAVPRPSSVPADSADIPSGAGASLTWGIMAGLSLAALAHGMVVNVKNLASREAIFRDVAHSSIGIVIAASFVFWAVLFPLCAFPTDSDRPRLRRVAAASVAAALILGGLLWVQMSDMAWLAHSVPRTPAEVLAREARVETLGLRPMMAMLASVFLLPLLLRPVFPPFSLMSALHVLASILCVAAAAAPLACGANLRKIRADICAKSVESYRRIEKPASAFALYGRLFNLNPSEPRYHVDAAQAFFELARSTNSPAVVERMLPEAEQHLIKARFLNPYYYEHTANLASLYAWWAIQTKNRVLRQARADISEMYFQQATRLAPQNPSIWTSWAILAANARDNPQAAAVLFRKALSLDPENAMTHKLAGDFYDRLGRAREQASDDAARFRKLAVFHYEKAIAAVPRRNPPFDPALCRVSLARLHYELGDRAEAIRYALEAYPFLKKENRGNIRRFVQESQPPPDEEDHREETATQE